MNTYFESLGRALYYAQLFETVMHMTFQVFQMMTDEEYMQHSEGCFDFSRFKVPISRLAANLNSSNADHPRLEDKIKNLIDNRNLLVHRWSYEIGIPNDQDDWEKLSRLALLVETESREVTKILLSYLMSKESLESEVNSKYINISMLTKLFK